MGAFLFADARGERFFPLAKKFTTIGGDAACDGAVESREGTLFTVFEKAPGQFELNPSEARLRVNGQNLRGPRDLLVGDRIEWDGGSAVFTRLAALGSAGVPPSDGDLFARVVRDFAEDFGARGSLASALRKLLGHILKLSAAETAYLLSEQGEGGSWDCVAACHEAAGVDEPSARELVSHTILREALAKRAPVCAESLVGHPWAEAPSVAQARLFSAACVPLFFEGRVVGALYLFTRTPGRCIRREKLAELEAAATLGALFVAANHRLRNAERESAALRRQSHEAGTGRFWNASPAMSELEARVDKLAPSALNLILQGETGVGKEVVARRIHEKSLRAKGPFVAVNCAAIPEALLESTLFGHERGAFTGAVKAQIGKFAQADGGTLLLDEIAELPLDLQAKLLRAIQEKTIEAVGAPRPRSVDVRVIVASHEDLEAASRKGRFRPDLYFRLNGATIKIPSLRERAEEILPLARYFLSRSGAAFAIAPAAEQKLLAHGWPGNVRELEQVVLRAAALSSGAEIQAEDFELGADPRRIETTDALGGNLREAQDRFTRTFVDAALVRAGGNRAAAAAELGISERSLYRVLGRGPDREV